ncbi:hypothetical protein [Aquimarina algicola]|uniref:Uncharacterized protein n=1 Tax=Aquimarina algicola TaxID=2589995 RepID=A0A504JBH2_9FLAO|nr:hypothetical protein [Aquimarina algicola]TPN85872.1 hypothetical protein FHK87_11350 [Aquimarina algicola]
MAPLKFEDRMREKLEGHTIEPSSNSWERLALRIDNTQLQKKNNQKKWWLAVAAIFIGILTTTMLFRTNTSSPNNTSTKFVVQDTSIIKNTNEKSIENRDTNKQLVKNDTLIVEKKYDITTSVAKTVEATRQKKENQTSSMVQVEDKNTRNSNTTIANTILKENKEILVTPNDIVPIHDSIIHNKVEEVIAKVAELEKNNRSVSDEEIDQLLYKAQREIAQEKIFQSDYAKVNATALLEEIEGELDETFKKRVFEALKTGFQKVKTTIVERNH